VLYIQDNLLDGVAEGTTIDRTGINFINVCRPGSRQVLVSGNEMTDLSYFALFCDQSAGVRLECNVVDRCRQAVWFRSSETTVGSVVELLENRFKATALSDPLPVMRVEKSGSNPGGGVAGISLKRDNFVEVKVVPLDDSKYIEELDSVNAVDLAAINNTWAEKVGSGLPTIVTNVAAVSARMATTAPNGVTVAPLLTTDEACGGVSGRQSGLPAVRLPEDRGGVTRTEGDFARTEILPGAPTPFRDAVDVRFTVTQPGAHVELEIFNIIGQRVATLVDERLTGGAYVARWDGRSTLGEAVSSGIYFARLRADATIRVMKLVRVRQ
jgi:hypothetical protein